MQVAQQHKKGGGAKLISTIMGGRRLYLQSSRGSVRANSHEQGPNPTVNPDIQGTVRANSLEQGPNPSVNPDIIQVLYNPAVASLPIEARCQVVQSLLPLLAYQVQPAPAVHPGAHQAQSGTGNLAAISQAIAEIQTQRYRIEALEKKTRDLQEKIEALEK